MTTPKRRFATPETLTDDTTVLGVPVKEWNKAFVGAFEKSLAHTEPALPTAPPLRGACGKPPSCDT